MQSVDELDATLQYAIKQFFLEKELNRYIYRLRDRKTRRQCKTNDITDR